MILSAVTDEVTPNRSADAFDEIFQAATSEGITNFEVRMVEAKRYPFVEAAAWNRLKTKAVEYGIHYSTVSPGLFKVDLRHDLMPLHSSHLLAASLDLAETIDVSTLVTFGIERSAEDTEADFQAVLDTVGAAVDVAAARGFDVQLENLPGTWADTSDACLALLEGVGRPTFGYVWDTGNLYEAEQEHFRAGYDKLKPFIRNVHLKDGSVIDGVMVWQHFGTGVTDIAGQVHTLLADGYDGTLTLEAKCEPHMAEDFFRSMTYLKSIL